MNHTHAAGRALITVGLAAILMLAGACASTPLAPESALDAAPVASEGRRQLNSRVEVIIDNSAPLVESM